MAHHSQVVPQSAGSAPESSRDEALAKLADSFSGLNVDAITYLTRVLRGFNDATTLFNAVRPQGQPRSRWSENCAAGTPEQSGAFLATNYIASRDGLSPYGADWISEFARATLRHLFSSDGEVYFLSTGTAANGCGIAANVTNGGKILAAADSHILTLEANAIAKFANGALLEGAGECSAKITPEDIERSVRARRSTRPEQRPVLEVVFLSNPTERGEVYSIDDLNAIHAVCDRYGLKLGIDGARLPYALAALGVSPARLMEPVDFVTLSMTKTGGCLGAALIFKRPLERDDYERFLKGMGQMVDTTYYISSQFAYQYHADSWWEEAARATQAARILGAELRAIGCEVNDVVSNAVFLTLPFAKAREVIHAHPAYVWDVIDSDGSGASRETIRFMIHPNITSDEIRDLVNVVAKAVRA